MSKSIKQNQEQIIQEFSNHKTWEAKYKYIIQKGQEVKPWLESEKSEDLKVKGCQSQVWLKAYLGVNQRVHFKVDSDALIVKGLAALLLQVYSDQTPQDILKEDLYFIEKIGLSHQLSMSRTNGLYNMIRQIKYYAQAFEYLNQTPKTTN